MNITYFKQLIGVHKSEFLITGIAQLIYMSQSLIQNKLFAVNFDTDGFGRWSLLVSVYTLIAMLPFTALDQGVYSIASTYKKEQREKRLFSMVLSTYGIGFFIYTLIGAAFFLVHGSVNGISISLFLCYAFLEILVNTFVILDNAYRNRKRVLSVRTVNFTGRLIMLVLLGYFSLFSINHVLAVLIITDLINIYVLRDYWLKIDVKYSGTEYKDFINTVLSFSAPLLTWAIFGWFQNMIGRWYLGFLESETDVALYTMMASISYFIPNAIYTIISTYVMPIIYSKDNAITKRKLLTFLGCVFMVMLVYLVIVLIFGDWIVLLLADEKYLSIVKYLPYTTFTAILYVIAMLSTIEIYRSKATKRLILPTITPGLLMTTIGYFLIKYWSLEGAVYNYMLGQVVYFLLIIPLSLKSVKK